MELVSLIVDCNTYPARLLPGPASVPLLAWKYNHDQNLGETTLFCDEHSRWSWKLEDVRQEPARALNGLHHVGSTGDSRSVCEHLSVPTVTIRFFRVKYQCAHIPQANGVGLSRKPTPPPKS